MPDGALTISYLSFRHSYDKSYLWELLETFESKIFTFPLANHLWLDLTPTPT